MMKLLKLTSLFVFLFGVSSVMGQIAEPTYKIGFDVKEAKVGDTIEVYIHVTPPLGWHIYSTKNEGCEIAPIMAELEMAKDSSYKTVGSLIPIGDYAKDDAIFECKIWSFSGVATFKQKLVVLSKGLKVKGVFQGQMCNDSACVPLFPDDFEFTGIRIVN